MTTMQWSPGVGGTPWNHTHHSPFSFAVAWTLYDPERPPSARKCASAALIASDSEIVFASAFASTDGRFSPLAGSVFEVARSSGHSRLQSPPRLRSLPNDPFA